MDMARSLFLSTFPLSTRVAYALGDEARILFAADWKAHFALRDLLYFGATPATFEGLRAEGFTTTAKLILSDGMRNLVTDPTMGAILDWTVASAACTREKDWWNDFVKLIVATRLGVLGSWFSNQTPDFEGAGWISRASTKWRGRPRSSWRPGKATASG